jgi:hypothetical protein
LDGDNGLDEYIRATDSVAVSDIICGSFFMPEILQGVSNF